MIVRGLLGLAYAATAAGVYTVDRNATADMYWGIGGLSGGGATSRLLIDYKEPQRSQILDYLFLPNFGASLQILKVEIGGDSQSTDGTETSHMHSKDDLDVTRGYEWWLLKEAKKRNPNIRVYGLPWAFPGWVGDDPVTGKSSGSPFAYPDQTSLYIKNWVEGADKTHNVSVDYIGVWNERASSADYAKSLKKTLADAGYGNVKIVAKDGAADICDAMAKDKSYADAVDIIGLHYPSDYKDYSVCRSFGKPFWSSEESSSYDDNNGAACWARIVNSHYVLSGMTSNIMWNLVASYYHGTNWYGTSMFTATQPWTGHFDQFQVMWATAHTTQFSQIGWNYLAKGKGSGQLDKGGYFVTLSDPKTNNFSIIIAKISHSHAPCVRPPLPFEDVAPEVATFELAPGITADRLAVWRSNYEDERAMYFQQQEDVKVVDGKFTIPIALGDHITISTVRTARRGGYDNIPASDPHFPLPYTADFESKPVGQEAPFFADQIGAFEVQPDPEDPTNKVARQMVPELPIGWSDPGSNGPMTLIGMKEYQDVSVEAKVRLPKDQARAAGCVATRVDQLWQNGVALCVNAAGNWNLSYGGPPQSGQHGTNEMIQTGKAAAFAGWGKLKLLTVDDNAQGWLNDVQLFDLTIRNIDNGFGAKGGNSWFHIEYDDFKMQAEGDNWGERTECPTVQAGDAVRTRNCVPNGIATTETQFDITSNWQIKHIASGLCVDAGDASGDLTFEACKFNYPMQQWTNSYSTVRQSLVDFNLNTTSLHLHGYADNSVRAAKADKAQGSWGKWTYFPNTQTLRNQYNTVKNLGYPQCLSTC